MNRVRFALRLGSALIGGGLLLLLLVACCGGLTGDAGGGALRGGLLALLGAVGALEALAGLGLVLVGAHHWVGAEPGAEVPWRAWLHERGLFPREPRRAERPR